jgi:multiple sugar transport system substrate-binding protein
MPTSRSSTLISRRRLLAASALAAGGAATAPVLGACSASGGSGDGDTVTLTVMYRNNELTQEHIAEFEAQNSGIKINFLEDDETRRNAMLASGEPPDFMRGSAFGSSNFNARGLAANLDPYLEQSTVLKKEDLLPVNDSFRWDGSTIGQGPYYGIVKDWSQDATLWYNTALLEGAGVEPLHPTEPVSYDELLDIANRLTVKEGGRTQVYGLGVEWAWNLWAPIMMMIMQQGGEIYSADLAQGDLRTPEARRAIQWYVDFARAGVGPTSLDPAPDGADLSLFLAERMAITQDGYWYGGNFVEESDEFKDSLAMAPAPVLGDQRISVCYAGQGAWIAEASQHKDEAWKLMEYFMAGPPAQERARSGWGLPALESLLPLLPQDLPYQQQAYETAQNELQYAGPLPDSPYLSFGDFASALEAQIQAAITGDVAVDEACAQLTEELNGLLQQGKEQIG